MYAKSVCFIGSILANSPIAKFKEADRGMFITSPSISDIEVNKDANSSKPNISSND